MAVNGGPVRRLTWLVGGGSPPREEDDCQAVSDREGGGLLLKAVFMLKLLGGEKTD